MGGAKRNPLELAGAASSTGLGKNPRGANPEGV